MAKAKRKRPDVAAIDFTEARRQATGFVPTRVDVMEGERRVTLHTIRRRCPAMGWMWLSEAQRGALVRYWDLTSECDVSVKGCLAPPSGGNGGPVGAERRMRRRSDLEHARRACTGPALAFTDKALLGDAPPHLDALADATFGAPREAGRITARALIGITASEMAKFFGA